MKGSNEVPPQRGLRPCALRQRVPRPRLTTAVLIVAVFATFASTTPRAEAGPDDLVVGGSLYVGDHFVFVVDRSATMASSNGAGLMMLQSVLEDALLNLHPTQQFSIVAYGSDTDIFSNTLLPASLINVGLALDWVSAITPNGVNCAANALVSGVNILNFAAIGNRTMFYIADQTPGCPGPSETVFTVTAANWNDVDIHTFLLPTISTNVGTIPYLEEIAALNGGTFLDLSMLPPNPEVIRGDANGDGGVNIADALHIFVAHAGA